MPRSLPIALALAVLSLAIVAPAHAILYTVNFTVHGAWNDATYGDQTGSGSFSFDSSLMSIVIRPNGMNIPALNFDWAGSTWTTANADADILRSDSSGEALQFWRIGGDIYGISQVGGGAFDFLLQPGTFWYAHSDGDVYFGTLTSWSVTTSGEAPEPGALALFAPGLLALGLIRRRRS